MKECPSFPGFFASENGEIFTDWIKRGNRLGRFTRRNWYRQSKRTQLRWIKDGKGYWRVRHPQLPYRFRNVHILVLDSFSGPRPLGMQGRHLDGDKSNNISLNLKWGTSLENSQDRIKHGNSGKGVPKPSLWGEKNTNSILSDNDVIKIKLLRKMCGWSGYRIGKLLGIWHSTVESIIAGRSWKHIKI